MYNLNVNETIEYVSLDNILKYINHFDIFSKYLGHSELNNMFNSPLRYDKNPTCKLFIGRKGIPLYIDFGEQNSVCDSIGFVQKLYNLTFEETLNKIAYDFQLPLGLKGIIHTNKIIQSSSSIKQKQYNPELFVKTRPFEEYDLCYWNSFGISKNTLDLFKVYAVLNVYKDNKLVWRNSIENPIYCYRFKDNKKKCYRPLEQNKKYKFLTSSNISSIIQGYDQLPETGDLLIITKSLKDVMCLYELGYTAIAPNGEAYNITTELIEELKKRFTKIIIFYDNDIPGISNAEYLSSTYNLPTIYLPMGKDKDISDYYKTNKREKSLKILSTLTNL